MPFLPPNQQRQSTKGVSVVDDEHTAAGYLCGSDGSWHRASRYSSAPPWRTGYSACTANTAGRSWPGPRRSCPPRTARRRCRRAGRTAARRRPRAGRPCSGGRRVVDGRRLRTPRGHPRRSSSDAAGDRSPADSDLSSAECGVLAARYMVTTTGAIHATTVNQPTNQPINQPIINLAYRLQHEINHYYYYFFIQQVVKIPGVKNYKLKANITYYYNSSLCGSP